MRFIDLFAGLGGFHLGLSKLGHECVFASEKKVELQELYKKNYGIHCHGDISKIDSKDIPQHDILCAGFPCQPFSKAGEQGGLNDTRGNLFYNIIEILKYHKPKYFILENVANMEKHNGGKTWKIIKEELKKVKYHIKYKVLSPHTFGIPQIRQRIFIVGSRNKKTIDKFTFPKEQKNKNISIKDILLDNEPLKNTIEARQMECIFTWQKFIQAFPKEIELPSFPIWSTEFGATYPFEEKAPMKFTLKELSKYKGTYGESLDFKYKYQIQNLLPSYVRNLKEPLPVWKKRFIRQNRNFYAEHKNIIDCFIPKLKSYPHSWQKFEWNCKGEEKDLTKFILQFRSSGLRVKRTNYSPSLVASTTTQLPIIGWEMRYMTKYEAASLQSLQEIELPESKTSSFKALGNAVNAELVRIVAKNFIL